MEPSPGTGEGGKKNLSTSLRSGRIIGNLTSYRGQITFEKNNSVNKHEEKRGNLDRDRKARRKNQKPLTWALSQASFDGEGTPGDGIERRRRGKKNDDLAKRANGNKSQLEGRVTGGDSG